MKDTKTKILIVGHGLHGKNTLAEMIESELGYKFRGSSEVAATEVVYPLLKPFFKDADECFDKRRENRELWRALISDFNRFDAIKLCKLVCEGGYGYTGLRDKREVITAVKAGFFTHIIWINRPDIPEDDPTMTFEFSDLEALHKKGYCTNLAYVHNNTKEVLLDIVRNELSEFLGDNNPDSVKCLRVITRDKVINKPKGSDSEPTKVLVKSKKPRIVTRKPRIVTK